MSITIKLGAIVATASLTAFAAASEIESAQQQIQDEAGVAAQGLAAVVDDASEFEVQATEAKKPTAATDETKRRTAAEEAEARGLEADKKDEAVPVRICRREKTTGSRLGRKRCRTVQELERAAELQGAQVQRNSSQFKRVPINPRGQARNKSNF